MTLLYHVMTRILYYNTLQHCGTLPHFDILIEYNSLWCYDPLIHDDTLNRI